MMLDPCGSGLASTTQMLQLRLWCVGVEGWVRLVGGGLAHCWVLKHQDQMLVVSVGPVLTGAGWIAAVGVWVPCFWIVLLCPVARVLGGGGLVGLLFEICIVDASIN